MNRFFDILVAGEINADLILTGDVEPLFGQVEKLINTATLTIGSSSCIFACGAARLGLRVAFVGVVGEDLLGRFTVDAIKARDVDVSAVIMDSSYETGLSVILSRATDRAILTHLGSIASLRAEQISDGLLKRSRHLHVASYFLQTGLQARLGDLFRRAHRLGLTTSLDTNWDPKDKWEGLDEILALTDVFLPNRNEALAIAHEKDVEKAIRKLGGGSRTIVVKLGDRGGMAYQQNELVTASSLRVKVVDTVGAGDSFDAGFLCGYLNQWDLEKSLRLACAC
jgi:sugar/nucleoside kinase (ribokinase family)